MNGLREIKTLNERPATLPPGDRACSIHVNHNHGGGITSVILHSASMRDTKFIDWENTFQRAFFLAVLKMYGLTLEAVEAEDFADPHEVDKAVESYWGFYPQPKQEGTPGYEDAEPAE